MKSISKIALAVALVAILVLSIVVASVAWFTSNPSVNIGDVTIDAARSLVVVFDSENGATDYKYGGQQGNKAAGDPDAPYVYEAGSFNVVLTPSANDKKGKVKLEFGTVDIAYHPGSVTDVLITDLFTITANCYVQDANGGFVKVDNRFVAYDSSQHSGLDRYAATGYGISDSGYLMNGNQEALFDDGTYGFSFTFTFLPTASYAAWSAGNYASIAGYEVSSDGGYIGIVSYVPYKAMYHEGLTRYVQSNGAYVADENGTYVKVVSSYSPYASVQKYASTGNGYSASSTGTYIKIDGVDEYVRFTRYNQVNGFPYCHAKYMDATYTFMVVCSVEEV